MLLGIRADESITRYMAVARREDENYIIQHSSGFGGTDVINYKHVYKAYPIYDWRTEDVWTAPAILGWDYCKYYDLLEMAKVTRIDQRLAPPFGEEPFQRLWQYAKTYPELWQKMVNRVSGANTAALYSKTALYGFGDVPEKPQDMEWKEFLEQQIKKHDEKTQKKIRLRINTEIKNHFKKTDDPILVKVGHYLTGLSWEFLLMIAIRSDTKGRKVASSQKKPREQYEAARRAMEAGLSEDGTRY